MFRFSKHNLLVTLGNWLPSWILWPIMVPATKCYVVDNSAKFILEIARVVGCPWWCWRRWRWCCWCLWWWWWMALARVYDSANSYWNPVLIAPLNIWSQIFEMILSGIPYLYHSNIYIPVPNLSEENILASPKESLYFSPFFLKMGCSWFINSEFEVYFCSWKCWIIYCF